MNILCVVAAYPDWALDVDSTSHSMHLVEPEVFRHGSRSRADLRARIRRSSKFSRPISKLQFSALQSHDSICSNCPPRFQGLDHTLKPFSDLLPCHCRFGKPSNMSSKDHRTSSQTQAWARYHPFPRTYRFLDRYDPLQPSVSHEPAYDNTPH